MLSSHADLVTAAFAWSIQQHGGVDGYGESTWVSGCTESVGCGQADQVTAWVAEPLARQTRSSVRVWQQHQAHRRVELQAIADVYFLSPSRRKLLLLLISRPWSEGWPLHEQSFAIVFCLRQTSADNVLLAQSTQWCSHANWSLVFLCVFRHYTVYNVFLHTASFLP